jgi:type I restriction enzyme M protein
LLFDNGLAKKTKRYLFLKIQNDGFDLGAQRREMDKPICRRRLEIIKNIERR